tara:strand:+ start:1187 stop:1345 length:159 start_codon:yes stop_codon:yes gene_type:complete
MISKTIDALQAFDYYGESEVIEIAKGKYQLATDFSKAKRKLKRLTKPVKNDN